MFHLKDRKIIESFGKSFIVEILIPQFNQQVYICKLKFLKNFRS